jgi:hypothetical protein
MRSSSLTYFFIVCGLFHDVASIWPVMIYGWRIGRDLEGNNLGLLEADFSTYLLRIILIVWPSGL